MMAEASSSRVSRYKVRKSIGKGSYGEVFLVTHREDSKQVSSYDISRHTLEDLAPIQYVMKIIKLTVSSAKERLAAEQEV